MAHTHIQAQLTPHTARRKGERQRLLVAMLMTGTILVAEVGGGLLTNSLALVSDGGHMLSDLLSLGMALLALSLARRPPDNRRTYGFHRFEILAALGNGLLLFGVAFYILFESYGRLAQPEPVASLPMLAIAGVGLLANAVSMLVLRHHGESLNTRGVFLHVLSDTLSSVGVIVGGVVIALTGWTIIDPLLSVGIAAVILFGAYRLTRESVSILLESTPKSIPLPAVMEAMQAVEGVQSVHDVHVWTITSGLYALSAHVMVDEHECESNSGALNRLQAMLRQNFDISHTTLQIECPACRSDGQCAFDLD
jgi:cobalt-zinc-cadmium efflux system protein